MVLPSHKVSRVPRSWPKGRYLDWPWTELTPLQAFTLSDASGFAKQQTQVRLCHDDRALYVRFDCEDDDIWGTYTERDDPLYDEEVVELFIAPGRDLPLRYFEFELSPKGVLFDCTITHTGVRSGVSFEVNESWDAPGVAWVARSLPEEQKWWAMLSLPWQAIGGKSAMWRANFYRVERSRRSGTEFSCWSPTESASFHVPSQFGSLAVIG